MKIRLIQLLGMVGGACLLFLPSLCAESDTHVLQQRMLEMAQDDDPRVRFQTALSLGEVDLPEKVDALAIIARRDASDPWVRSAILSSVGAEAAPFLEVLIPEVDEKTKGVEALIGQLSKLVGTKGKTGDIRRLLSALSSESTSEPIQILALEGLSEGLNLSGSVVEGGSKLSDPLAELLAHPSDKIRSAAVGIASKVLPPDSPELTELIDRQIEQLKETDGDGKDQVQAAKILRLGSFSRVSASLSELLSSQSHDALQVAALDTLSTFNDPMVGTSIVDKWSQLGPQAKVRALKILLSRTDRALELLAAIGSEAIPANILDSQKQALLLGYPDETVAEKAKTLFAALPSEEDPELYQQYIEAVSLDGDRVNGKKIYVERCAQCHIAEGEGTQLGPDWSGLKSNTRETLLTSILYPNREVDPGFTNYILETFDGDIYTGVLAFSGPNSVILRRGGGQEDTILRKNIDYLEDTKMSIMPTNLEVGLSAQDMSDLLSFIETLQ